MPIVDAIDVIVTRSLPTGIREALGGKTVHLLEADTLLCARDLPNLNPLPDREPRYGSYQLCWECLEELNARL